MCNLLDIKILDKKIKGNSQWFLAKADLWSYLSALPHDFYSFEVQRGIVSNTYLDTLWQSLVLGEILPPITLSVEAVNEAPSTVCLNKADIIDGLQRTYRLWAIKKLFDFCELHKYDFKEVFPLFHDDPEGRRLLDTKVLSRAAVRKLLEKGETEGGLLFYVESFRKQELYFYLWTGLTDDEVIHKMLVLNAGQKRVSSTHQYEMLFLHCFRHLKLPECVRVFREKDDVYRDIARGKRNAGEFTMVSVITGIQSYIERKPVKVPSVNDIDESTVQLSSAEFFSQKWLSTFLTLRYEMEQDMPLDILAWIGKDTTQTGLMAAAGRRLKSCTDMDQLKELFASLTPECICLEDFDEAYNRLSSVRINVGNVVRRAIAAYFEAIFKGETISWRDAFKQGDSVK